MNFRYPKLVEYVIRFVQPYYLGTNDGLVYMADSFDLLVDRRGIADR